MARTPVAAAAPPPPVDRRLGPSSPWPAPSAKPGRASVSGSWIKDKVARAGLKRPPSIEGRDWGKIPGRGSLSESWVKDKVVGAGPARVPSPSRETVDSGCGKRGFAPTADKCGKKPRLNGASGAMQQTLYITEGQARRGP